MQTSKPRSHPLNLHAQLDLHLQPRQLRQVVGQLQLDALRQTMGVRSEDVPVRLVYLNDQVPDAGLQQSEDFAGSPTTSDAAGASAGLTHARHGKSLKSVNFHRSNMGFNLLTYIG